MRFKNRKVEVEVMIKLKWDDGKTSKGFWDIRVEVGFVEGLPVLAGVKDVNYDGKLRLIDAMVLDAVLRVLDDLNKDAIMRQMDE